MGDARPISRPPPAAAAPGPPRSRFRDRSRPERQDAAGLPPASIGARQPHFDLPRLVRVKPYSNPVCFGRPAAGPNHPSATPALQDRAASPPTASSCPSLIASPARLKVPCRTVRSVASPLVRLSTTSGERLDVPPLSGARCSWARPSQSFRQIAVAPHRRTEDVQPERENAPAAGNIRRDTTTARTACRITGPARVPCDTVAERPDTAAAPGLECRSPR